jgi:predicted PurR-regulated permease PerM
VTEESGERAGRLPRQGDVEERDPGQRERLTQQLAQQWAMLRAERRAEPAPITSGTSNFSRAQVPWGLDLAAAWSWRVIIISVAVLGLGRLLSHFAVITLPIAISLLVAALVSPAVRILQSRGGLPRGLAAGVVVLLGLGAVGLLLTFAGQQVANGATDLADQVVQGLGQIRRWLREGPLGVSDSQLNTWLESAQRTITEQSRDGAVLSQVTDIGTAVGHVVAGFFIVLFSTYFFLADGDRIWAWVVRLSPRAAREHVDGSGRVAWVSLTQFVRATVLVAMVDAVGVAVIAAILGLPFVLAIGVLVFLGAFIPMVGATVAGAVAVLVALVDQGPVTALLMLGGVVLVQQIEGHVLQPFLMGRFVSLHPLGVIIAIGAGVLVAGIAGALVAVPLVAAGNAVVQHLAASTPVGEEDPEAALDDDLVEVDADAPTLPAEVAERAARRPTDPPQAPEEQS